MAHVVSQSVKPTISQTLTSLDTTRPYTLQFYYNLFSSSSLLDVCTITVSLGDVVVYTNLLSPAVDGVGPVRWRGAISTTPLAPASREQTLSVSYGCQATGSGIVYASTIYLDDFSLHSL